MKTNSCQPFRRVPEVEPPTRVRSLINRWHVVRAGATVRPVLMLGTALGMAFLVGSVWSTAPGWGKAANEASPEQGRLFRPPLAEVGAAVQDAAKPAEALTLENLAWLVGDRESYPEAVDAFTKAIKAGGANPKPEYLLARGRCFYKQAVGRQEWNFLENAVDDLKKAIDKKLPESDEVEALYWLGMVHYWKTPPEEDQVKSYLSQAAQLAERQQSFKGNYAFGLEAIAQWGEVNLKKASKPGGEQYLQPAIEQFERLGQSAQKCNNQKHQFWAWNRLSIIGEMYYEAKEQPLKAYQVYQKGLPAKISDATEAQVRLLNSRNALLAKPKDSFQKALQSVKPPAADLIRDAEHALKLVTQERRHQWIDDQVVMQTYVAAAFCYHNAKDKDKALEYLRKALTYPQDPVTKPILEKFQDDWRKD